MLTYAAVSVVSLTASVNSVNFYFHALAGNNSLLFKGLHVFTLVGLQSRRVPAVPTEAKPESTGRVRSRIRYLSKKNSPILTNFPKLKKIVKIRTKILKCPSGRGLPTTTEEFDAFQGFMLIKI